MYSLRKVLALGFLIISIYACKFSEKESFDSLNYFTNLQYDKVDTISSDPLDFSFIFYFSKNNPNEKIYVEKDTVKHVFGHLSENGTFWLKEWITYTSNGVIIDNESQYVFVNTDNDSTEFILFGDDKLKFKVRIYEMQADSVIYDGYKEIEPESRQIKVSSSELVGNPISLLYQREFIEDTVKIIREIEVFITRNTKAISQKHMNLVTDDRIKTIANTR